MFVVRGVNVFPSAIQAVLVSTLRSVRGFAVVLDAPAPSPRVPLYVDAGGEVDEPAVERVLRDRLQVQMRVRRIPPGTIELQQHKSKRIFRRYAGERPDWLEAVTHE